MLRIAPGADHPPRAGQKQPLLPRVESYRRQERSGRYRPIRVIRDEPLGSWCRPGGASPARL